MQTYLFNIDDFRNGDAKAVRYIYSYFPLFAFYCYQFMGNNLEVDDIVSAVLQKVFEHRDKIHSFKDLKSYVYRSLKHKCIDRKISRAKVARRHTKYCDLQEPWSASYVFEKETQTECADYENVVKKIALQVIEDLPPRQKQIVVNYYFRDLDNRQISALLRIPLQHTSRTTLAVVAKIRQKIRAYESLRVAFS